MILLSYPGAFAYRELIAADQKFLDQWFLFSCEAMIKKKVERIKANGGSNEEIARVEYLYQNTDNIKIMENNLDYIEG